MGQELRYFEVAVLAKCYYDQPPIVVSGGVDPSHGYYPFHCILFSSNLLCPADRDIAASSECYPVLYLQRTHITLSLCATLPPALCASVQNITI